MINLGIAVYNPAYNMHNVRIMVLLLKAVCLQKRKIPSWLYRQCPILSSRRETYFGEAACHV